MISVTLGDLAELEVEAIFRPITADGSAATAGSRRVEIAAGPEPVERLRSFGELPVGSAMMTTAGRLSVRYIIHLVVRSYDQPATEGIVRRALENGIRRLDEWGIESLALPLLGTGPGSLDPEVAVSILVPPLREVAREGARRVVIVAESEYELELLERELSQSSQCHESSTGAG